MYTQGTGQTLQLCEQIMITGTERSSGNSSCLHSCQPKGNDDQTSVENQIWWETLLSVN